MAKYFCVGATPCGCPIPCGCPLTGQAQGPCPYDIDGAGTGACPYDGTVYWVWFRFIRVGYLRKAYRDDSKNRGNSLHNPFFTLFFTAAQNFLPGSTNRPQNHQTFFSKQSEFHLKKNPDIEGIFHKAWLRFVRHCRVDKFLLIFY